MYSSKFFGESNPAEIRRLVRRHGLATLVSIGGELGLSATALPVLYDPDDASGGRLIGHMARANPHCRSIAEGDRVLLILQAPDAYVSPVLYRAEEDVPTWNYSAVQIHGRYQPQPSPDEAKRILRHTVSHFEALLGAGWDLDAMEDGKRRSYVAGTVAFSVSVEAVRAVHRLSQDKTREDVAAVIEGLARSPDPQARAVASEMCRVTLAPRRDR